MLPGLQHSPRARVAAALLVFGVLASRLVLMPDGPWEQDEALFAHGVLNFDLRKHSPHPPGFPGWIALGKLINWVVGDPLLSLRLLASFASTALFVALARLLDRRFGPGLAVSGAMLFTMLPVSWAHAPRAFSTTPALACAALALLAWQSKDATLRLRHGLGWALLGLGMTIRPQLVLVFGTVALVGLHVSRDKRQNTAFGMAAALLLVLAAYVWAAIDSGGPSKFLALLSQHYGQHASNIEEAAGGAADAGWSQHGLVRGLGGPIPAVLWFGLTLFGAARLWLRGGSGGKFLVALAAVSAATVQFLHHPGFPRYAVTSVLATLPLVLGALAPLPRKLGIAVIVSAGVGALGFGAPALWAMHSTPLPIVAASRSLQRHSTTPRDIPVYYSHGSFSFLRYAHARRWFERDIHDAGSKGPRPTGPYDFISPGGARFLPGLTVAEEHFDAFPEAAWDLSQHRFDSALVVRNGVWIGPGNHVEYGTQHGERFVWASDAITLHPPGSAESLIVQLELNERRGPQRVRARIRGQVVASLTVDEPGFARMQVPLERCKRRCAVKFEMPDAERLTEEDRRLSVRLRAAWVRGRGFPIVPRRWSPGLPGSILASDVELRGFHRPDLFMKGKAPGAWTEAHASLRFAAVSGRLRLRVARPKHLTGLVVLKTGAETMGIEPGSNPEDVWIQIAGDEGQALLQIDAPVFVPKQRDPASNDARELGLIVLEAEYLPAP